MSKYIIRKVGAYDYAEFGKLKSVEIEDQYLVITNENGEVRRKSKITTTNRPFSPLVEIGEFPTLPRSPPAHYGTQMPFLSHNWSQWL
jgi:hypothetical protein